jgi:hypothetical protein
MLVLGGSLEGMPELAITLMLSMLVLTCLLGSGGVDVFRCYHHEEAIKHEKIFHKTSQHQASSQHSYPNSSGPHPLQWT